MALTLLIGGARSGKSALAVEIGRRSSLPVTFVATATAVGADGRDVDADMERRITRHVRERPPDWSTIEEKLDLVAVLEGTPSGVIIIDCLTLWTSNMMWDGRSDQYVRERAALAASLAAERPDPVVVISNEVGLGIVPDNDVARRYRDIHGFVNQQWAAAAQTTLHLVAGRAVRLVDPWDLLDEIR